MSLTILSLGGKIKLFPPRESLVSDFPARNGNVGNLFLQCNFAYEYLRNGKKVT
jgi:hypothetical protein